jgi:hypothetical protein
MSNDEEELIGEFDENQTSSHTRTDKVQVLEMDGPRHELPLLLQITKSTLDILPCRLLPVTEFFLSIKDWLFHSFDKTQPLWVDSIN